MLIEWAAVSAAIVPQIKKYAAERAIKLGRDYSDSKLAQLYKRVIPDQKLVKAVEAFVLRFDKELDSAADVPTLTVPAYRSALEVFLSDPDVLETLETPLDAKSDLDWDFLSRRWTYLKSNNGESLISLPADFDWAKLAKRYCEAVRNQALANPELRPVIEANATLRAANAAEHTASLLSRMAGPVKTFDLPLYAESIKELYRYLRLGSLDADWAVYENRVHLENVYVPQSAKQALPPRDLTRDYLRELKARGTEVREDELLQQKEIYADLKPMPILEVVDNPANNRLVILGDPGLGKSTLLKYLSLRWAENPRDRLTLLVELRRTVDQFGNIDFLGYIGSGRGQTMPLPRLELDKHLRENQTLVLFDGLDEVIESQRSEVVSTIINFVREYPKTRVIITTRIHGYHPGSPHPEQFRDAQFQQFTVQDFSPREVERFISVWHNEAFIKEEDRVRYQTRLRQALADSPSISELAANPLLLTMMAILNRVQDLPRDRGKLYERCAELLLKNWDLEKFPERMARKDTRDIKDKLGPDQKMRILELVAAAMQEERTGLAGNIIAEDKLKKIVQCQLSELDVAQPWSVAEDLIAMLRERNFMLAYLGDHQYAFVHRTFLEYFVARDLKYRLEKTSTFSIDQLATVFRRCWRKDEWQEVFRLLCGMIGSEYAAKCVNELLNQKDIFDEGKALLLAADCLQEIRELGSIRELRDVVRSALMHLSKFGIEKESAADPDTIREILEVRERAVSLVARGWKEEAGTLRWLKEQVDEGTPDVRWRAVDEIAHGWKNEPWILDWLKERILEDKEDIVRSAGLMVLANGWREVPWLSPFLKERAVQEQDSLPAMIAISALLSQFGGHETTEWLKGVAVESTNAKLRNLAVIQIGYFLLKDDRELMEWLKDVAVKDQDPVVRQTAVEALSRDWGNQMKDWLRSRAENDPDEQVRAAALEALQQSPTVG